MTIREKTRKSQVESIDQIVKDPEAREAIQTQVVAVYDAVDALTADQRALLVNVNCQLARSLVDEVLSRTNDPEVIAYGRLAYSLLALAGYANESNREDAGATSTSDRRVDEAVALLKRLLASTAQAAMSPEDRAILKDLEARIEKGEDPEQVLAEARAHRAPEVPAARVDDGMYL